MPSSAARWPERNPRLDVVAAGAKDGRIARPATARLRFVTAASLFDGHDASINIMRRLLQSAGTEVVHLGHNRSVAEIVDAAIQEGADGIAVSSYQGGHVEFFGYMIDSLRARDADHIAVFGGGGGVIVREEIDALHARGITHIYSPEDGQRMGLSGMIEHMIDATWEVRKAAPPLDAGRIITSLAEHPGEARRHLDLGQLLGLIENDALNDTETCALLDAATLEVAARGPAPILGITGTGGSGKSSLTDELIRRFRLDQRESLSIALLAIDPTRRKSGGALLGDRIRMNAIDHPGIYMRSVATRDASGELPAALPLMIAACRLAGAQLVIVETPGIGQGDAGIIEVSDVSLYVMTPEFGAASQLEKIDMLDFADVVAINKFDRRGAEDALRDVSKQVQRNRERFDETPEDQPVFGTIASRFNDDGVTALYQSLVTHLIDVGMRFADGELPAVNRRNSSNTAAIIPPSRQRYLADIAESVRDYHRHTATEAVLAREIQQLDAVGAMLNAEGAADTDEPAASAATIQPLIDERRQRQSADAVALIARWPERKTAYREDALEFNVRGTTNRVALYRESLAGTRLPRIALPHFSDAGDLLTWLRSENLPGSFPFTAGVFPFKREGEDPTRMFAGEGDAFRTNRRFRALSRHAEAKRLSTAFDSVTLYGNDPALRPDIYGKIGNAGVSIATVEDMQALYEGFDLCAPSTSVSMTINGPAPTILAFFFITAIRQQVAKFVQKKGREPDAVERRDVEYKTLGSVRGTVQADILKEDQGQNTCLFSTEFSLRMMADIQAWFIDHDVRNFYSVSISGYHIAEAGANPITQLALTLANGFTYVESYLARGMAIDDFAPNLSFFFSNGMDPEYTVLGRVARRIWAIAMRERYGGAERSQKLKYHIQTSGRSLHAQEMAFNDIRTTLQALIAIYDHCNSLHTNAYDEAITTPTAESVRRAMAIQLIINREWGLAGNENPNQGSFVIDELTSLVEAAVLDEFDRLAERGGVLGAMETGYQRGRIQDESLLYERRKHDGSLPIIGVNTFVDEEADTVPPVELARSSDVEKRSQIDRLADFQARNADAVPAALDAVRHAALEGDNVFAALMHAGTVCSLGQITQALFEVGGQYRRNL